MTLRTTYIVGLIACTAVGLTSLQLIEPAQAETLKITGPNGELKQQVKRQYGPTTVKDTFWSIAQKVRPNDKVSVYQVMAALFDANPHAFSGNNYNTLERGMILLIPSADVMAAIPNDLAKRRAEQDDRKVKTQALSRPVISKPAELPKITTPKKSSPDKPLQIAQKTPAVEVQTKAIKDANDIVVNELNNALDKANAKTLMLTDELARSQDELMVSNNDNQVLKNKIEQMSLNISSLEEDLQLLQEKFERLALENKKIVDQTENIKSVEDEPADFWRSLMDHTILLILAASIPLLMLFGFIFWLLSRRSKKTQQSEINMDTQPEQQSTSPTVDDSDDSDDMVIHLDSNDEESIDDLLDLDSVDLKPEAQMSNDADMDMASDMFISEKEVEDDEGTSLDDLWAEAMEDQDSELEPLEDEDNLDNLLDGLDNLPETNTSSAAPEDDLDGLLADLDVEDNSKDDIDNIDASAEDDIDSLLAEFDMPAESADSAVDEAVNAASTEDDIDSLLAEFDMPAESADSEVDETVNAGEIVQAESASTEDDIDSLLAEFDMPAESVDSEVDETVNADEIVKAESAEDDIDSLLAEFDMPAESADSPVDETVNTAEIVQAESAEDDIDSLLAEFDMPAESADSEVDETVNVDEIAQTESASEEDDIDSLLAEFDMPTESTDIETDDVLAGLTATNDSVADEPELPPLSSNSVDNGDDLAALIAAELQDNDNDDKQDDESSDADIDALLADLDQPVIEPETSNAERDALQAQIAAELDDQDVADDIDAKYDANDVDESDTSDEDIDALLAGLDQPVIEPETSDAERDALQAQIAAELDDEDVADDIDAKYDANDVDESDTSDEDIDALLADLDQPVIEPETNDTERDALQAQIAAELDDQDVADDIDAKYDANDVDESDTSDEDIDALLAGLDQPVIEPETSDAERDSLQAQIAAELDDQDVADDIDVQDIDANDVDASDNNDEDIDALLAGLDQPAVESADNPQDDIPSKTAVDASLEEAFSIEESTSDDDSLNDDMNTLLAGFKDDVTDDNTSLISENKSTLSEDVAINDETLFAEFDEYLTDSNLTEEDDIESAQNIEVIPDATLSETNDLDALFTQAEDENKPSAEQPKTNKDSGFFNDLKSSKPAPELLDWESDLLHAAEEQKTDEPEVSDDDLLAAFSQSLKDDNEGDLTSEDEYILSDDNLTVDEALAALDQNEQSHSVESKTSDDDLMRFERENGYIDIDKLLNDADENDDKTDQYKDVNVDMDSSNTLVGNPDMVDVDDEENSVNAKLDLARAYIEIEDQDSARALLKEVGMDGNERQKLEAKNLLDSFS